MKSVLISIQPKWCELIAAGSKTIEVRKTKPKLKTPFKVYIYCTKARNYFSCHGGIIEASDTLYKLPTGVIKCDSPFELQVDYEGQYDKNNFLNGKVIGEFVCDDITKIINCGSHFIAEDRSYCELNTIAKCSCLDFNDMKKYLGNKDCYAWHISNLVIYDKPRELNEFLVSGNQTYDCPPLVKLKRPFQSWGYVESLGDAQ